MLCSQDARKVRELSGLLESWKHEVLFELLVIILDERTEDASRILDGIGRQVLLRIDPPDRLFVHEQHPLEDSMLPHQVLGRRDLFFLRRLLLALSATTSAVLVCGEYRQPQART